jgi:Ankyrin repeats (many copies)
MPNATRPGVLYALLGLNRAGQILYGTIFVLAVPALLFRTVILPGLRFSDQDEQLFRAARHGDGAGVERALDAGADVNAAAPVDRKTALFRAAILGHADVVRVLLDRGADVNAHGSDGRSALEVIDEARRGEKDPAALRALDEVAAALRAKAAQ